MKQGMRTRYSADGASPNEQSAVLFRLIQEVVQWLF